MKLYKTNPVYSEVALSGEDDIAGGRGGRRGRGGRSRSPRGGRPRPPHPREREDELPPLEGDEDLAGRAERQARRKMRRKQKSARKTLRSRQKLDRLQQKAGGGSLRSGRRGDRRGGQPSARPGRFPSNNQSFSTSQQPAELEPVEQYDDAEYEDADYEDGDFEDGEEYDDFDALEEEMLEGTYAELGAAIDVGRISRGDARRIFQRVKQKIQTKREQIQARRQPNSQPAPSAAPSGGGWGPVAKLNQNIRIQAGNGHRAAVMELRPGLYLVADVRDQAVLPATEGGIGAVLPMLMAKGAANAIQRVVQKRRESGKPRLWNRHERNNPVLNPPQQPHLSPSSPPLLLAGPVAENIGCNCEWVREEDL
jgi:hypothetical protein